MTVEDLPDDGLAQKAIGAGALVLAAALGFGALQIPGQAGYAGVGPNFLPWVVTAALSCCGAGLLWQAFNGGYRQREAPSGAARGDWPPLLWVCAGVVANAALIERIGFILACTLCFMLAVRGLRQSEGAGSGGPRRWVLDFVIGCLIAAPAYWLFTLVLGINLPGLTGTGWL
ncbi:MAG: tripartite tricarboxylate transporter TctB family protein [Rubrivivax sp.]|nr:tripartite tricarboxylate transporter TctB family protein [Rubrivivax sp.]